MTTQKYKAKSINAKKSRDLATAMKNNVMSVLQAAEDNLLLADYMEMVTALQVEIAGKVRRFGLLLTKD